jgi:hypothetical protein
LLFLHIRQSAAANQGFLFDRQEQRHAGAVSNPNLSSDIARDTNCQRISSPKDSSRLRCEESVARCVYEGIFVGIEICR